MCDSSTILCSQVCRSKWYWCAVAQLLLKHSSAPIRPHGNGFYGGGYGSGMYGAGYGGSMYGGGMYGGMYGRPGWGGAMYGSGAHIHQPNCY